MNLSLPFFSFHRNIKLKIRSSHSEAFLRKGVLKIWSFPVNFLYIFRKPFPRNTSGWLLLKDVQTQRQTAWHGVRSAVFTKMETLPSSSTMTLSKLSMLTLSTLNKCDRFGDIVTVKSSLAKLKHWRNIFIFLADFSEDGGWKVYLP